MRIRDAMICWRPARMGDPEVRVVTHPDPHRGPGRLPYSAGACDSDWRQADDRGRLALVFIHFNTLVVRDGIPPADAHRAFLAIDEYRRAIAPDQDGAEETAA